MTLDFFKKHFCCRFEIHNQDNVNLVTITAASRRSDNYIVDQVKKTINIQKTNDWISESNTAISVAPWSWDKLIYETKRAHLDYFAQRASIEDWYPLNKIDNPDISDLYCE